MNKERRIIHIAIVDSDKSKCTHQKSHENIMFSKICFDKVWLDLLKINTPFNNNDDDDDCKK